jgi:septum formation protein
LQIILASTSKTRQELLRNTGLAFTAVAPGVDETLIKDSMRGATPKSVAEKLAHEKAKHVSLANQNTLVIGADQTLGLGNEIFDKPNTLRETDDQLKKLRGKKHTLYSAVDCLVDGKSVWSYCGEADLYMRDFSDAYLKTYLEKIGNTYSHSVGGYQLEAVGINLFERVDGDYFTILGLPLLPLIAFLRQASIIDT